MNQPLSFIEGLRVTPASEELRKTISAIGSGTLTNPAKIERALTPILVSLEVMESQQVLLNDLLEARRFKRQKKKQAKRDKKRAKGLARIERNMKKWGSS